MYVPITDYSITSFGSKYIPGPGAADEMKKLIVRGKDSHTYAAVYDALNEIFGILKKISAQDAPKELKAIYNQLQQEVHGIKAVYNTMSKGVVFKNGRTDLLVSGYGSFGTESLRFADIDPITGKVKTIFCCDDKRLVKTNTTDIQKGMPNEVEFYRKSEYGAMHSFNGFIDRLNIVDTILLRLRVHLNKPEVQAALKKDYGATALANQKKVDVVTTQTPRPNPTPKPSNGQPPTGQSRPLSAYERLIREKFRKMREKQAKNTPKTSEETPVSGNGNTEKPATKAPEVTTQKPTPAPTKPETPANKKTAPAPTKPETPVNKKPTPAPAKPETPANKKPTPAPAKPKTPVTPKPAPAPTKPKTPATQKPTPAPTKQKTSVTPKPTPTPAPKNTINSKGDSPQKAQRLTTRGITYANRGVLTGEKLDIFEAIRAEYTNAFNQMDSIGNARTRNILKYFGSDDLAKGESGSRELKFIGIGKNGEDISVAIRNYNRKPILVIISSKDGNIEQEYGLTQNNQLMKNLPLVLKFGKQENQPHNLVEYHTPEELEALNMEEIMKPLKERLEKYSSGIKNEVDRIKKKKAYYAKTNDYGNLDDVSDTIKSLLQNYKYYKNKLKNLPTPKKQKYKADVKIDTDGNSGIIINELGKNRERVRLSFPVLDAQRGIFIQVLDDSDNVSKSLYIMDDKLVKFDSKELHARKHNNRGIYFHSQEYIDNSNVRYYIEEINNHLISAVDKAKYLNIKYEKSFSSVFRSNMKAFETEFTKLLKQYQDIITTTDGSFVDANIETQISELFSNITDGINKNFEKFINNIKKQFKEKSNT